MNAITKARVAGQSGVVTREQALGGGMTRKAIEWQLRRGHWAALHPGVYRTTPGCDDWEVLAVAALLHAGPGAVLSGRSAGHARGLVRAEPAPIEVSVPWTRAVRPSSGIVVTAADTCLTAPIPPSGRTGSMPRTRFGTSPRDATWMEP